MTNYISLKQCKDRVLYCINSRNLDIGVFNKEINGFVSIRTKFNTSFLDVEYHYDTGAPFGTAKPIKELEPLPEALDAIAIYPGIVDMITNRMVDFDKPIAQGGRGWYFLDTNEASDKIKPCTISNDKLFDWLNNALDNYGGGKYIPLALCEDYAIYQLNPTHIEYGVFHKDRFIGVNGKTLLAFVHIDAQGNIQPIKKIGQLPKDIMFTRYLPGSIDKITGRVIEHHKYNGRWYYTDNGEVCNNRHDQLGIIINTQLKDYLQLIIDKESK